ncbi:MAG TPA: allantoate amidohydrolase [Terracidiphilus sp.]|jgi:allantoate deiminase|nr:allantoate amidohydrolase [Terracidiphilus sp.]
MKARAERAIAECRRIAAMTEEPGRTTRRFLTPPVREVHALLRDRMEKLGMSVRVDAVGNLRGLWFPEGAETRRLMIGSHIDTVPDAGAFDGVLGVTVALEWAELAQQMRLPIGIELVAFSEEEGVRFGVPFLGSRAMAGRFDEKLLGLHDAHGHTVAEAIHAFGLDAGEIHDAAIGPDAAAFVEIHIEQGPVLEAENAPLAAVTAIVGQTRGSVLFKGHANHAGTTPMPMRRDALAGAAEWILAVEQAAKRTDGLVATTGRIAVTPDASNAIAGEARVSLDLRHAHDRVRLAAVDELVARAQTIAQRRGLEMQWTSLMNEPAVPMDERLTAFMADAIEAAGYPPRRITSGAGHDAMVMAGRVPAAMLFIRSPGGISHHPAETVLEEDVEAAMEVGQRFLERMAASLR